ncbi:PAS domain S-box-containing protein [Catenuloplanes nepalensis]|uniref:Sensor-like histidine kinase SenX3 n=1 Tax=Catenuloplanes nepalensis TaxID=587533 RepID=A0ABT9N7H9_9ACTN|nr:ATP-binding protein [Catenuloplanes nepalensis]MDP9799655.1 PAS domain S-box-containing protein [Catenuloplanes nepalensis]
MLSRIVRTDWRHLALPLAMWLVLCGIGAWGVLWVEQRGERAMQDRFGDRVQNTARAVAELAGGDGKSGLIGRYLEHAISIPGAQVYLLDADGRFVAGSDNLPPWPLPLASRDPVLAEALAGASSGHYGPADAQWYFDAQPVPDVDWRIVAAVPVSGLYGPVLGANVAVQSTAAGLAALGLIAVFTAARAGRNRAALRASEAQFRGLFDYSMLGMVVTRTDGEIERVNRAFGALLGHPPEVPPPGGWPEILHPDDAETLAALADRAMAGEIPGFTATVRLRHTAGRTVPVEVTSTIIHDELGEPLHFSTQLLDVSERARRQEEQRAYREELAARARDLQSANAELQAANQRVADMVAMLTHDVRQPIATIAGYCELLTDMWDDTDDRAKRRDVDRIAATAASMSGYVEEILTLTQVDADTLFAHPSPLRLADVIAECLVHLPVQERAGITVTADERLWVLADPRQLHQMLVNLIGNGLKYGEPPILIRALSTADGIEIEISDSGEGVPEDFVPRLFDRFARATSGVAPTKKGTGLGLYIVRQLAVANSGDVTYRPHQPSGASFVLRLPTVDATVGAVRA